MTAKAPRPVPDGLTKPPPPPRPPPPPNWYTCPRVAAASRRINCQMQNEFTERNQMTAGNDAAYPHTAPPDPVRNNTTGDVHNVGSQYEPGWTQRQDAAIRLCVPDSGLDWLDKMIKKSHRNTIVGQVLCGDLAWAGMAGITDSNRQAAWALELANAAIAEFDRIERVPDAK